MTLFRLVRLKLLSWTTSTVRDELDQILIVCDLIVWRTDLHWSEESKMYCDVNVNDEGISTHILSIFILTFTVFPKTNPTTSATRDICQFSPSYSLSFRRPHPNWDIYLTSCMILITFGHLTDCAVYPLLTLNLEKARTIGRGRYGYR